MIKLVGTIKNQRSERWFKGLSIFKIAAAAAIALFAGFGCGSTWSAFVVGLLGALVSILASLLSLNQFQENWIEYITICE